MNRKILLTSWGCWGQPCHISEHNGAIAAIIAILALVTAGLPQMEVIAGEADD